MSSDFKTPPRIRSSILREAYREALANALPPRDLKSYTGDIVLGVVEPRLAPLKRSPEVPKMTRALLKAQLFERINKQRLERWAAEEEYYKRKSTQVILDEEELLGLKDDLALTDSEEEDVDTNENDQAEESEAKSEKSDDDNFDDLEDIVDVDSAPMADDKVLEDGEDDEGDEDKDEANKPELEDEESNDAGIGTRKHVLRISSKEEIVEFKKIRIHDSDEEDEEIEQELPSELENDGDRAGSVEDEGDEADAEDEDEDEDLLDEEEDDEGEGLSRNPFISNEADEYDESDDEEEEREDLDRSDRDEEDEIDGKVGDGDEEEKRSNEEDEDEDVQPVDFIDGEAEVSGSDSSDDEDPDDDVAELIDDEGVEALDNEKVRKDVAKVYHKEIANEDKRLLLQLQERYLEDGDLQTDHKRARKFRWGTGATAWLDNARDSDSSSDGLSDDEDDENENIPVFRLKTPFLPAALSNEDKMLPSLDTSSAPPVLPSSSLSRPSGLITSYLVKDKQLNNILSSKRQNPFEKSGPMKRIKPGSKLLFDLLMP